VRSRSNRLVQDFRRLDRDAGERDRRSVLLAEGVKLLEEAEREGMPIETVLYSEKLERHHRGRFLLRRLRERGPVPVAAAIMDYIHGGSGHQGILALVRRPRVELDSLLAALPTPLLFVGIGLQDPGNVGSLIRAADAVGAGGVLLSPGCADPFGRRAVRASMGSVLRVPVMKECEPVAAIERLGSAGIRCVAADPHAGTLLWEADVSGPIAVVLGAEGEGLPRELLDRAATRIRIPMRAGVDSLNVAATACLLGYEIARHRREPI
jgi:TrmH family RNA methyltransferase